MMDLDEGRVEMMIYAIGMRRGWGKVIGGDTKKPLGSGWDNEIQYANY